MVPAQQTAIVAHENLKNSFSNLRRINEYLEEVGSVHDALRDLRPADLRVERVLARMRPRQRRPREAGQPRVDDGHAAGWILGHECGGRRVAFGVLQLHLPRKAHLQLARQWAQAGVLQVITQGVSSQGFCSKMLTEVI